MISQETIQGLIDALDALSDATNDIVLGGGDVHQEAYVINSLNSTSTTDALSANMGRELKEMIENISSEGGASPEVDAYTKAQTDTLLDAKADKATTYTKTEVDTALSDKANVGASYTKSEANTLLAGKADTGDSYTKSEDNALLANKADKATTYTKSEVDSLIQGGGTPVDAYTKSETDALLATKANSADVYTKTEANSLLASKANTADVYGKTEVYTKTEVNTALAGKADASTTYTKTEVDTALATKADASTTYTKTEVDTALSAKANASTTYTKTETDTMLSAKANASTTYTKTEVDTALSGKASTTDVTNKANLKLATSGNTVTGEIRFGKDGNGNYGYIPEGADTVIPFRRGGGGTLIEKTITANGDYYATDDNADGYSKVSVNIPSDGGTLIEKTITANGDYYATDDNADGYSKVSVNIPSDIPTGYTIASCMTHEDWADFRDSTNLEQYENRRRGFLVVGDSNVFNAEQIWDIRDVYDEGTILSVIPYNTYTKSHDGDAFGMSIWYVGYTGLILVSKESLDAVKYENRGGQHVGKVLGVDSKGTTWYMSATSNYSGGYHRVLGGALPLHVPELDSADKLEDFLKLMICIHENDFTLFSLMGT